MQQNKPFTFLLAAINAKYIHSNPAVYSLRSYAGEKLQQHIRIEEFTINEQPGDILERLYEAQPDAIGFSCYIWNINMVRALLNDLPKVLPYTALWLGGPEVSFDAEQWLRHYPQLTGVMIGEGEKTFRELLAGYLAHALPSDPMAEQDLSARQSQQAMQKEWLKSISGLCLPSGYTAVRKLLDLSALPFIYQDMTPFDHRIVYYESSRGCPFHCSYCLSSVPERPSGGKKKVRLRDTALVEKELQFFLDRRVPQVKFVDRTFNCNREHTRRIWTYLRDHDNGVTNFHFEIEADLLNDDEIALLGSLRPGLFQVEIGVQSTNPHTIREIKRTMDLDRLEKIVARIRAFHTVHQHLDLIVGLPEEDYESFAHSFDRVYNMQPNQLQMGFLKLLKGSYMYEHATDYGIIVTDAAPYEVLRTHWLTYQEVRRLKRIEEMVELYYNSGQYTHTLPYLIRQFGSAFTFFEQLADFYQKQGYFVQTPSRAYRYQVLRSFGERDGKRDEPLRELLLYDMYLRENLKTRPDFAPEITREDRAFAHQFYGKEAQERRYLPDYREADARQLARQTHLEHFSYPVWYDSFDYESVDRYVLFDYTHRDPLSYNAKTIILTKNPIS